MLRENVRDKEYDNYVRATDRIWYQIMTCPLTTLEQFNSLNQQYKLVAESYKVSSLPVPDSTLSNQSTKIEQDHSTHSENLRIPCLEMEA